MSATDTAGLVRLTGFVEPESEVFARNLKTLQGGLDTAKASGAYEILLFAEEGDPITLWYMRGNVPSQTTDFVIKLEPAKP